MHIAFFVNSIEGESPAYTTTVLALAALMRGHEVFYVTPEDFVLGSVLARGVISGGDAGGYCGGDFAAAFTPPRVVTGPVG